MTKDNGFEYDGKRLRTEKSGKAWLDGKKNIKRRIKRNRKKKFSSCRRERARRFLGIVFGEEYGYPVAE